MKKIIALFLCMVLALGFTGCVSGLSAEEKQAAAQASSAAQAEADQKAEELATKEELGIPTGKQPPEQGKKPPQKEEKTWPSNRYEELLPEPPISDWEVFQKNSMEYEMYKEGLSDAECEAFAAYVQGLADAGYTVTVIGEDSDGTPNNWEITDGEGHYFGAWYYEGSACIYMMCDEF